MKPVICLLPLGLALLMFQNCAPLSLLQLSASSLSSFADSHHWENQWILKESPTYTNPVTTFNCADPATLYENGRGYLSCTGGRFRLYTSKDLVKWRNTNQFLMNSGARESWASPGREWAPDLAKVGNNYVAYYTQNDRNGQGAIGASATNRIGRDRFKQANSYPLAQGRSGGVIDPSFYRDPNTNNKYLLYKFNGNAEGLNSKIMIRELDDRGLDFKRNSREQVLKVGGRTGDDLIEGQELVWKRGFYYLFYSVGAWNANYRVKVARSKSIYGPYTGDRLVLSGAKNGKFHATGHGTIIKVRRKMYYFYHAMDRTDRFKTKRYGMVDRIFWKDGWPLVNDGSPSENVQFVPETRFTRYPKVDLSWPHPGVSNPTFSMTVVDTKGKRVYSCLNSGYLKRSRSMVFDGDCKSQNKKFILTNGMNFRVCAAQNNQWSGSKKKVVCTPYKRLSARAMRLGRFK